MNSKSDAETIASFSPAAGLVLALIMGTMGCVLFYLNRATAVPASWGSLAGPRNDLVAWFNTVQAALLIPLFSGVLGVLVLRRRAAQRIGWLFMALSLCSAVQIFLGEYAILGAYTRGTPLPGTGLVAWMTNFIWVFIYVLLLYLLAIFPNGRFLSRRWRILTLAALCLFAVPLVVAAAIETPMSSVYQIDNPFVTTYPQVLYDTLFAIGMPMMPLGTLLVLAAVLLRFRRSQGRERQQMKWLLAGMMLLAALLTGGLGLYLGLDLAFGGVMVNVSVLGPLLGIGVALLRHRLYDIDIIIRRTLLYTAVSASLALVYFGTILLLQTAFSSVVAARSPLVIVVSTLISVALFNPLRLRLQTVIDRRFFRQKYNAQQVLAQFAQTARDEVEMEQLTAVLLQVVQTTIQPEQISLWLKPGQRNERKVGGETAVS
ncbi:MAG: hypothetical protein H6652_21290 [Ardenticatenaceae bacterium]|nr:hypothetical protein [Ardenticatenaceae bacterium]